MKGLALMEAPALQRLHPIDDKLPEPDILFGAGRTRAADVVVWLQTASSLAIAKDDKEEQEWFAQCTDPYVFADPATKRVRLTWEQFSGSDVGKAILAYRRSATTKTSE